MPANRSQQVEHMLTGGQTKMSKRLEKILRDKRKQQEESMIDHEQIREAWVTSCANLMATITNWLTPLQGQHLLEIQSETIPIFEDQLGAYEVDALQIIFLQSDVMKIRPVCAIHYRCNGSR